MAFVELTEGDLEPRARAACESTLFGRLEATGVATDMVALNATGCFLTVDERDVPRVRTAAASLNVALRLRPACACVTLSRAETNWPLPSLARKGFEDFPSGSVVRAIISIHRPVFSRLPSSVIG